MRNLGRNLGRFNSGQANSRQTGLEQANSEQLNLGQRDFRLELSVFLCGALCMSTEMVGARLLAPYVGTSAIVWASLISAILAFMALGAWLGGKIADNSLSQERFASLLSGAGLGCALCALSGPSIANIIISYVQSFYLCAILCSSLIFGIAAAFFGMLTPYATRLRLADLKTAGSTVGRLQALATCGSILGSFLGGFILISFLPSRTIIWAEASILFILSIINAPRPAWKRLALAILCLIAAQQSYSDTFKDTLPKLVESATNSIRILESNSGERTMRLLLTDPGYAQSGMYVDNPNELCFNYTKFYSLGPLFNPKAQKILLLGGGAGSVPKWLLSNQSALAENFQLTVVELDKAMTKVAKEWFALPIDDARLQIIHEDARIFVQNTQEKYDLIFVDVFNSQYSVPFHIGTAEAANALSKRLNKDGLIVMNIISAGLGSQARLLQGIYKGFQEVFSEVRIYCVNAPRYPEQQQNIMLVASLTKIDQREVADLGLQAMLNSRCLSCEEEGRYVSIPALRDNFAPVERYTLNMLRR